MISRSGPVFTLLVGAFAQPPFELLKPLLPVRSFTACPPSDAPQVDRMARRDSHRLLEALRVRVVEIPGQPVHDAFGGREQAQRSGRRRTRRPCRSRRRRRPRAQPRCRRIRGSRIRAQRVPRGECAHRCECSCSKGLTRTARPPPLDEVALSLRGGQLVECLPEQRTQLPAERVAGIPSVEASAPSE